MRRSGGDLRLPSPVSRKNGPVVAVGYRWEFFSHRRKMDHPQREEHSWMSNDNRTRIIPRGTPESAAMVASVKRAMAITAALNRLTFDHAEEIRAVFSDLIGHKVDASFALIPPFYTTGGEDIRV